MIVQFKDSFARDLRKIKDQAGLQRVKETIEHIEQARTLKEIGDLKKLKAGHNYYRIRIGEYRIGAIVKGAEVTLVRCLNRREIYRYFP